MIRTGYSSESMNEAKQVGNLYHFTPIASLIQIIKSNKLAAHVADNHSSASVSLTRDSHLSRSKGSNARIVIDGDKLSNRYKVKPINITSSDPYSPAWETESEERVLGDITDLKKYIVSVDLHIRLFQDPKYVDRTKKIMNRIGMDSLEDLIQFLDKHKIPHGIYGKMSGR